MAETVAQPRIGHTATVDETQVWRMGLVARCCAWAVVVLGVAGVAVAAVATATDPSDGHWIAGLIMAGICGGAAVWSWRYVLHPAIIAAPDGLTIRNPWRTHARSWDDVVDCQPSYYGIAVADRHGGGVYAFAVKKSNVATWRERRTRADEVAEGLARRARLQRAEASGL
jgi:hypothetical protein